MAAIQTPPHLGLYVSRAALSYNTSKHTLDELTASEQKALCECHQSFPLNLSPDRFKPYAELIRIHRPAGIFMFYFPCLYGIFVAASLDPNITLRTVYYTALHLLLLSILMRGALCTWNDIIDRKYDRQVARTRVRPLARRAISTQAALLWNALQAAAVAWTIAVLPPVCMLHAIPWLALHILYPFTKRITSHPQFVLGLAHSYGAILAFPALGEALSVDISSDVALRNSIVAVCLSAAIIAWTLLNDTIYAAQDAEDDAKAGIGSTVMFWGEWTRMFLRTLGLFQISALVAIFPFLQVDSPGQGVLYGIFTCVATFTGVATMVEKVDLSNPASCGWWFNTGNVLVGVIMAAGFVFEYLSRFLP